MASITDGIKLCIRATVLHQNRHLLICITQSQYYFCFVTLRIKFNLFCAKKTTYFLWCVDSCTSEIHGSNVGVLIVLSSKKLDGCNCYISLPFLFWNIFWHQTKIGNGSFQRIPAKIFCLETASLKIIILKNEKKKKKNSRDS